MKNNATIRGNLQDLLGILDARATVTLFEDTPEGSTLIKQAKVYEILANDDLMNIYKTCDVVGLNFGLVTNILVSNVWGKETECWEEYDPLKEEVEDDDEEDEDDYAPYDPYEDRYEDEDPITCEGYRQQDLIDSYRRER